MGKPDMHVRERGILNRSRVWSQKGVGATKIFFFLSVPNGGASSSQMLRSAFGVNFSWFAQINSALLLPQKQNQRLLRSQCSRAHPIWGCLSSKVKAFFCYKTGHDKWQLISSLSAQLTDLCLKAPQLHFPLFSFVYPLSGLINIHDILKCFQTEYDYEA